MEMTMMMMPMTFWNGYEVTAYLFRTWTSTTRGEYAGWLIGIFFACILLQTLDWLRCKLQNDTMNSILAKDMFDARPEAPQFRQDSLVQDMPLVDSQ